MSETSTATASPARSRFRFAFRLRTMLLLVLVAAAGLGYHDYRKRRAAVDDLLAQLKIRVLLSIGPTSPHHDPVLDPGGTYARATKAVRNLSVEHWAVADLIPKIRRARIAGNETGLRNAMAALQDLGPAIVAARPEVLRVSRGEGMPAATLDQMYLARGLAIHVLGKIAKEDPEAIDDLIAILALPDSSPARHIISSAASEIGASGAKARKAVPQLMKILSAGSRPPVDNAIPSCVSCLGSIGPEARRAVPILKALARDRNQPVNVRGAAIEAVANLSVSHDRDFTKTRHDASLSPFLAEFEEESDPWIQQIVQRHRTILRHLDEMKRRKAEQVAIIAADRARGGRPRPARTTETPPGTRP